MDVDNLADVEQVAVEGWQSLARLHVEALQLRFRLVDRRMEQFPLCLLVFPMRCVSRINIQRQNKKKREKQMKQIKNQLDVRPSNVYASLDLTYWKRKREDYCNQQEEEEEEEVDLKESY